MDFATLNNSWVDSYLDALLSAGLSTEHAKAQPDGTKFAALDADRQVCAKYYVQQLMSLDEERLRDAWHKVSRPHEQTQEERDVRLEYLSWRAWGMRRKRAAVANETRNMLLTGEHGGLLGHSDDDSEAGEINLREASLGDLKALTVRLPQVPAAPLHVPETLPEASEAGDQYAEVEKPPTPLREQPSFDASYPASPPLRSIPSTAASPHAELQSHDTLLTNRFPRLYIILISLHGLVRGNAMELGKDPDTGGQVKYVVELARALGRIPSVLRVDLLTRLIEDPKVDKSYGVPEEPLGTDGAPNPSSITGSFIVRLPCGPRSTYLRKEDLWPHVREFADRAIEHANATLAKLQESGEPAELYVVHGHYADAGEAAALISHTLGVDMVLTGHSLGRNKKEHLLKSGNISIREIEATYRITRRIEAEERALDAALNVFTSTQQEINEQWGLYDGFSEQLSAALQLRPCKGYHTPRMTVIPPGLDFSNLKVKLPEDPWEALLGPSTPSVKEAKADAESVASADQGQQQADSSSRPPSQRTSFAGTGSNSRRSSMRRSYAGASDTAGAQSTGSPNLLAAAMMMPGAPEPPFWREVTRFLRNPRKPVILAMSRPDAKKNVSALIKAYGQSKVLRDLANLVLVLGNRDVIDSMAPGSAKIMTEVLKLIDAYDLHGSVAYPKRHSQADISDIYLLAAATRGVFVNIALQEPFGLTLIEAAAHAVPIVATTHGGPVDIISTLHNGILVEPTDTQAITEALLKVITNSDTWEEYSSNGRNKIIAYCWPSHCAKYLRCIEDQKEKNSVQGKQGRPGQGMRKTLSLSYDDLESLAKAVNGVLDVTTAEDFEKMAVDRISSMPSQMGVLLNRLGQQQELQDAVSSALAPQLEGAEGQQRQPLQKKDKRPSLLRSISPLKLQRHRESPEGRLFSTSPTHRHRRFVTIVLDDIDDVTQLPTLLGVLRAQKGADGGAAADGLRSALAAGGAQLSDLGVGVMFPWGCREMRQAMEQQGVALGDLDFLISDAGSLTWQTTDAADGGSEQDLVCDEDYERHIDFRWDPNVIKQVLQRILRSKSGWGKLPIRDLHVLSLSLSEALSSPAHFVVEITQGSTPIDVNQLLASFRKKLRTSGVRCQLLLTSAVPSAEPAQQHGPTPSMLLHITPQRSSRALAMRYLAHRRKIPLENFTLVAFTAPDAAAFEAVGVMPPSPSRPGRPGTPGVEGSSQSMILNSASSAMLAALTNPATEVRLRASDGDDLLGGTPKVVLLPGVVVTPRATAVSFPFDRECYDKEKITVVAQ